jgi:hypothetical protein
MFLGELFEAKKKSGTHAARRAARLRTLLAEDAPELDLSPTRKGAKSKAPSAGVVYLLKAGEHFKIGKSISFDKRLEQIKLQLPYAVEVVLSYAPPTFRRLKPIGIAALLLCGETENGLCFLRPRLMNLRACPKCNLICGSKTRL